MQTQLIHVYSSEIITTPVYIQFYTKHDWYQYKSQRSYESYLSRK